jgi:hypothetical protein
MITTTRITTASRTALYAKNQRQRGAYLDNQWQGLQDPSRSYILTLNLYSQKEFIVMNMS